MKVEISMPLCQVVEILTLARTFMPDENEITDDYDEIVAELDRQVIDDDIP